MTNAELLKLEKRMRQLTNNEFNYWKENGHWVSSIYDEIEHYDNKFVDLEKFLNYLIEYWEDIEGMVSNQIMEERENDYIYTGDDDEDWWIRDMDKHRDDLISSLEYMNEGDDDYIAIMDSLNAGE